MIAAWTSLIRQASYAEPLLYAGVRKIVEDFSFELDSLEQGFEYEDLCYTPSKGAQLKRNYWNQESWDAALEKLVSREGKEHSSVAVRLQAAEKDSRSQGFCMQNLVITRTRKKTSVDIFYRSTEVIQKFAADLMFFAQELPPVLEAHGIKPDVYRFKFANLYVSAMFAPIYIRFEEDPADFLRKLQRTDPRFARTLALALHKHYQEDHSYSYRTRVKMFDYWRKHITKEKADAMEPIIRNIIDGR